MLAPARVREARLDQGNSPRRQKRERSERIWFLALDDFRNYLITAA